MKYINISDGIFIRSPGSCPRSRTWGYRGGWVVQKNFFRKFNQIWCVSNLHQWHMQRHNFLGPHPLGPWAGAKRSNIIKSQSQSQFQNFLNQSVCVFSQLKDIKHMRRDFHSVAWVMPQGWDLCTVGGWESKNFFSQIQPDFVCELFTWMAIFLVPASWGLEEGPKGQISLNLNYKVNFKDF